MLLIYDDAATAAVFGLLLLLSVHWCSSCYHFLARTHKHARPKLSIEKHKKENAARYTQQMPRSFVRVCVCCDITDLNTLIHMHERANRENVSEYYIYMYI